MWRILFVVLLCCGQKTWADDPLPRELQAVGITEHLGSALPKDLRLTNAQGQSVELGSFFDDTRPVVLVLQYYECPMLCGVLMNGVNTALQALPWAPGREYRFVGVSIDPAEGPELAAAKQQAYAEAFGRPSEWHFLTGDAATIQALTNAVGFGYRYDADQKEFAHAAVVTVLTPGGMISRYLYGIEFAPRDMKLALVEAGQGKVGSVVDRLLLYCFHFDPSTHKYGLMAMRLMRVGGGVMVVGLGGWLLFQRRREKKGEVRLT